MKRKIIIPLLAAAAILAVALAASNIGRGDVGQRHILVAYFSATGNTKALAETTATVLHGDMFRIAAEEPYTDADLGHGESARVTREQADPDSRPVIKNRVEHWEQYDTVVIGYPIWNGDAPRIVSTFVQSYDFTGKRWRCSAPPAAAAWRTARKSSGGCCRAQNSVPASGLMRLPP